MLLFKKKYKTVGPDLAEIMTVMCFVIWVFVRTSIILFVYSESNRL